MTTFYRVTIGALVLFVLFLLLWPSKDTTKPTPDDVNDGVQLAAMSFEIESLKADKQALNDSIFGLMVDKGHTEIELNQARAQLDDMIKTGKQYRVIKDTPKIVSNCDSIIDALEHNYFPAVDTFAIISNTIDSMRNVQVRINDSIIDKDTYLRNMLVDDLQVERVNNQIIRDKLAKQKKGTLLAGIGGFIAGLITSIIIHK